MSSDDHPSWTKTFDLQLIECVKKKLLCSRNSFNEEEDKLNWEENILKEEDFLWPESFTLDTLKTRWNDIY